jgi:hypothetical protein
LSTRRDRKTEVAQLLHNYGARAKVFSISSIRAKVMAGYTEVPDHRRGPGQALQRQHFRAFNIHLEEIDGLDAFSFE